jgi:glycosyltransferase involved in cell wall biosynthesis
MVKLAIYRIFNLTHRANFLAVSEFKRASWRTQGSVAVLAPQLVGELADGKGYDNVTVVCNELMQRQDELGADDLLDIAKSIPIRIIGRNPGVDGAIQPKDYAEFRELFRSGRIYLYTIRQPFGDGYNTAMLEAMQMGMAVVTVDNPSSPIINGENGLVGRNKHELLELCKRLLANPQEVDRLGQAARETVEKKFSRQKFISTWQNLF